MSPEEQKAYETMGFLGIAGLFTGLGVLLASKEKLTLRIIIGRAISSTALGLMASGVLIWIPNLSIDAKIAIACFLASIGTSSLERIFQKKFGGGSD